ncbi:DUF4265 domain-containing protein [Pendulispora rubella]|uniref:DUF4265 domain-containing protein n=1 Tax=Pendulispora rubella TaxID=2741070 RepID=A0ABZ2LL92_9BACT
MKLLFHLDAGMWHGSATESLWVMEVGPGQYRLENSPFFAFDVSFQDVVLAKFVGGTLTFVQVLRRGGHSTYRIIPRPGRSSEVRQYWAALERQGCSYEEGPKGLLAVDVPPEVNIFEAYAALQAGEAGGAWSFEEGHCGHAVG